MERICSICKRNKSSGAFSKTQWKKAERKCKQCIANPPTENGGGSYKSWANVSRNENDDYDVELEWMYTIADLREQLSVLTGRGKIMLECSNAILSNKNTLGDLWYNDIKRLFMYDENDGSYFAHVNIVQNDPIRGQTQETQESGDPVGYVTPGGNLSSELINSSESEDDMLLGEADGKSSSDCATCRCLPIVIKNLHSSIRMLKDKLREKDLQIHEKDLSLEEILDENDDLLMEKTQLESKMTQLIKDVKEKTDDWIKSENEMRLALVKMEEDKKQWNLEAKFVTRNIAAMNVDDLMSFQDALMELSERVRKEMRVKLDRKEVCGICMDSKKAVAFQCGHQTCATCSTKISNCHICRKKISIRVSLY